MDVLVEVEGLNKRFGDLHAVRDLSLRVSRGEVLGFLGPNGAGKSTSMKMITGFLTPTSGSVRIKGMSVADDPIRCKREIGYLAEGAPAYGEMTPRQFLGFIGAVRGLSARQRRTRITELAESIHLEGVLDQPIETLSKGYKRRVGLAQAVLHDPEILILDEPTDGLDPNQKHEVRSLIQSMAAHKAIIVSTHILEEVDAVCTRAVIIAKGQLLFDGTPDSLAARARYHNAVVLTVARAHVDRVCEGVRGVVGVLALETRPQGASLVEVVALPKPGVNLVAEIGGLAREQGWEVSGLNVERGRLDDVFRDVTQAALSGQSPSS